MSETPGRGADKSPEPTDEHAAAPGSTRADHETWVNAQPTQPGPGQPYDQGYPPYQQPPYAAAQGYPGQPPYAAPQGHPGQAYSGQQPYPGQPGYPGQPYPPQPYAQRPLSEDDQRLWATLTHISIPFFGFIGPLVAYLLLKDRSTFLKDSTGEALNFSILFSIALTVSSILSVVVIGFVLLPVVWIAGIVFCILAAIASNRGELYRYPLNWRLVK